jgi:chemotaxis protein methyltransferase CheR
LAGCELTQAQFTAISGMLYTHAGIRMREGKEGLVRARLMKRLRKLGLSNFTSYLDLVSNDTTRAEFAEMVDALTTNKTSFLREPGHFDYLRDVVLPTATGSFRIWSAGCATGEEPYTLAMLLNDEIDDIASRDVRILATDISHRVISLARAGQFSHESMLGVPAAWLGRYWIRRLQPDGREMYEAMPSLRKLVHFARLNLMEQWPMQGPLDAIMCRNVMIYFDKETQQRLIERFWALLRPGGHLFVGHSEGLTGLTHRFRYVQPAIYTK